MRIMVLAVLVLFGSSVAMAAVESGSAQQIYEDETGGYPRVGNLSANADGNFLLPVDVESDGVTNGSFHGLILDADGATVGKPVTWVEEIDGERIVGGEHAAVAADGKEGLATWYETDPNSSAQKSVMQRFDARTAEPVGEPTTIEAIDGIEALEAYRDGYAAVYSNKISGEKYEVLLQLLDAEGAPEGKPRSLYEGRFGAEVTLVASASATRLLAFEKPYKGPTEVTILKPDGSVKERALPSDTGFVYDISHASGATFILAGQTEGKQLYTQQLTGTGKLKPRRVLPGRPGNVIDVAYGEAGGLVVYRPRRGLDCGFVAQELAVSGKPRGAAEKVDYKCDMFVKERADLAAGDDGGFALAFSALSGSLDSTLEVDLFGAGLRLR